MPKQRRFHCSHMCHNMFCVNPKHFAFETAKTNGSRERCRNGSAYSCGHKIKPCLFQRQGKFLPCRNDLKWPHLYCKEGCEMKCFDFGKRNILFQDQISFSDADRLTLSTPCDELTSASFLPNGGFFHSGSNGFNLIQHIFSCHSSRVRRRIRTRQ
jgi:hypothetical protein